MQRRSAESIQPVNQLETTGLSTRAINNVRRIGHFLNQHRVALGIGTVLEVSHFIAGNAADPSLFWSNVIPFVTPAKIAGNDFVNAIGVASTELSKLAILKPIFDLGTKGLAARLEYRDRMKEHLQRLQEGREPLTHQAVLTIDLTNRENTGNHEGELVDAIWKHRTANPEMWTVIEAAFGPICELVKENTPQPANIPDRQYLRTKTLGYRDKETLTKRGAGLVSAMLLCMLDKDHTVFDSNKEARKTIDEMIGRAKGAFDNVDEIVGNTRRQKVILPKIAIVNDRKYVDWNAINPQTGGAKPKVTNLADQFPSHQGYDCIIAEQAVIKHILNSLKGKRVALIAAPDGEAVANNFSRYLKRYLKKNPMDNPPKFINIHKGKLEKSLKKRHPDVIFLLGENDARVAGAAESIISEQANLSGKNTDYPVIPVITFLEGHTSDATIKKSVDLTQADQQRTRGLKLDTIYLHDILADEVANRLFAMAQTATSQPQ